MVDEIIEIAAKYASKGNGYTIAILSDVRKYEVLGYGMSCYDLMLWEESCMVDSALKRVTDFVVEFVNRDDGIWYAWLNDDGTRCKWSYVGSFPRIY